MTNLITKTKAAVSNTVLFAAAVIMMGLGFAFVGALALFGLMAMGVALLAAPFVARPVPATADAKTAA